VRILVADDEAIIRLGLKSMLEQLGHQVVGVAPDGISAVELARAQQPDLAILDIKMPGLDGLDAAKAMSAERPLPIVVLTAYGDRQLVERAATLDVHGYLVKPIRPAELGPALEIAVSRFEQTQALRREAADLREALHTRGIVEEAKRTLMARHGLSEQEAFSYLQSRARRERRSMREVSEQVLEENEADAWYS
jgi:response regulator NasT